MKHKPNPNFKAIYNPYTRELVVKYGNAIIEHIFSDYEEWVKISYNDDENHPNYLHVQLDYDEMLQLLFYPRVDGDDDLHEDLGSYFHYGSERSPNITLVYTDKEMSIERLKLINEKEKITLNNSNIDFDFHSWTETHFEVVSAITFHSRQEPITSKVVAERLEAQGTGGLYELAVELTNEFEEINRNRQWDGEFFDEIEGFIEERLK